MLWCLIRSHIPSRFIPFTLMWYLFFFLPPDDSFSPGERHRDHGVHQWEDSHHDQPVSDWLEPSHQPPLHAAQRYCGPGCHGRLRQVWKGEGVFKLQPRPMFRRSGWKAAESRSHTLLLYTLYHWTSSLIRVKWRLMITGENIDPLYGVYWSSLWENQLGVGSTVSTTLTFWGRGAV